MTAVAANVREKFSTEFVSGDAEARELKSLFRSAEALPQLVLFDSTIVVNETVTAPVAVLAAPAAAAAESVVDTEVDVIEELRLLFAAVA